VTYVTEGKVLQPYGMGYHTGWRCPLRPNAVRFFVFVVGFVLISSSISAHHGVTNYDMKKTIELSGTVTDFEWANPHCLAHMDVMDDGGQTRHWTLELSSTFTMAHRGWDKATLKRGDRVMLEAHPAKNGSPMGINSGPGFALKIVVNGKDMSAR
jgi:hypothetical protein